MSASTVRASDRAYQQLREMLLDLRLSPGTVVNEQSLAEELEIGRMPVHEALARLANDGFLTVLPRRGTVVTAFTLNDVMDRLLMHNLRFWRFYFTSRTVQPTAMLGHEELLAGIRSRDGDKAERAMRQHISASRGMLQSLF
jgi:DNA-binding GntR family transcriptional regulator